METLYAIYKCRACNVLSAMVEALDNWTEDTRKDLINLVNKWED